MSVSVSSEIALSPSIGPGQYARLKLFRNSTQSQYWQWSNSTESEKSSSSRGTNPPLIPLVIKVIPLALRRWRGRRGAVIGYTHSYAVSGSTPYSGFVSWQTRDSSLIYDQSPAKPVSCFLTETRE